MKKIDLITLGCSKNLVDSEHLIAQLESVGFQVEHDADVQTGDIAIVNTCGFIADAQQESINMILELAQRKTEGKLERLYVMGCLSERFMKELGQEIPEVDRYFGKFNWMDLLEELGYTYDTHRSSHRHLTTPPHYAYIKISEGCDRHCAYCAIPAITGKYRSRPMEDILDEVRYLVGKGVSEFQIIAQELTYYGIDIYGKRKIAELTDAMAKIPGVHWLRLHYAYPTDFPMELLTVMRENSNICRYIDIALQHSSDKVLKTMHRHITGEQTRRLVKAMREAVPGIHIRTTLMVGFPGETDEDFRDLCQFVKDMRFERMGAFAYSHEVGTPAEKCYKDNVSDNVKQARLSKLMRIQQSISAEIQETKIGQVMPIIIDRVEGDYYVGRTEFDSPEVDPEVLVKTADVCLQPGNYYEVLITGADDFDLYASICK